jgi:hypothetical protein
MSSLHAVKQIPPFRSGMSIQNEQKQIPFGNDKQKGTSNGKGNGKSNRTAKATTKAWAKVAGAVLQPDAAKPG